MMGRGLQPDQASGWEGEVPGAACVPAGRAPIPPPVCDPPGSCIGQSLHPHLPLLSGLPSVDSALAMSEMSSR